MSIHVLVSLSGVVQGIFRYTAYQLALRITTSKYPLMCIQ